MHREIWPDYLLKKPAVVETNESGLDSVLSIKNHYKMLLSPEASQPGS